MNILVINCGSSSLKYQLIDSESEKVKLRYKESNPFSVEYFLPYVDLLVECKGEIDPISGTFIIEEIIARGEE